MTQRKTPGEAMQELKDATRPHFEPSLLRMVGWLDRQLRRSPRLYRFLSR